MTLLFTNTIRKFFKKTDCYIWIIYLLLSVLPFFWVKDNSIISGGDFGWPVRFVRFFDFTKYIWDSSVSFGYSASRQLAFVYPFASWGYAMSKVGFDGTAIQRIIFSLSFFLSGAGSYLLFRRFIKNHFVAFLTGLIYMFSPYSLIVGWVPVYGISFAFYCFLPLNLYLFDVFISSNSSRTKLLSMLITVGLYMGTNYANPVFFILFLVCLLIMLLYKLILNDDKEKCIRNSIEYFFVYFLLNFYWLIPFLYDIKNQFQAASNATAGLINDTQTISLNSVSIKDAFRMTGLWTIFSGDMGDKYYDWQQSINSLGYIVFSFVIPIIGFLSIFLGKGDYQYKKKITFLFILLVLAILLNTAGFYFHVSTAGNLSYFARLFRSGYIKLGLLLVLPAAIIFGISLENILDKIKRGPIKIILSVAFITLILFFYGKPFFNGQIIKSKGSILPSYDLKVPEEYFKLESYDVTENMDSRYLSLPFPKSYNIFLNWGNDGYNGADFIRTLVGKPVIFNNNGPLILSEIVKAINSSDSAKLTKLFKLSNIGYVLVHKDLEPTSGGNYLTKRSYTPATEDKLVISNSKFDLYKVNNIGQFGKIYGVDSIIYAKSEDFDNTLNTFDQNDYFAIVDQNPDSLRNSKITYSRPEITYHSINPTKYDLQIQNPKGPVFIAFSEKYDPMWTISTSKAKHYSVDGGLNGWEIDTDKICKDRGMCKTDKDGKSILSLSIEYTPQRIFLISSVISIITLLTYSVFNIFFRKKK